MVIFHLRLLLSVQFHLPPLLPGSLCPPIPTQDTKTYFNIPATYNMQTLPVFPYGAHGVQKTLQISCHVDEFNPW